MANDLHKDAFSIVNEASEGLWGVPNVDDDVLYTESMDVLNENRDFWTRRAANMNYTMDDLESEVSYCVGILFYNRNNPYE